MTHRAPARRRPGRLRRRTAAGSPTARAVPEPGRYGTDEKVNADAEPPRRITRLAYRLDGEGFVADKPQQLFVLDAHRRDGAKPVQLTDEPSGAPIRRSSATAGWCTSGSTGIDELTDEIAVIDVPVDSVRLPDQASRRRVSCSSPPAGSAATARWWSSGEVVLPGRGVHRYRRRSDGRSACGRRR